MKQLLKIALKNYNNRILLAFTIVTMCLLTIASQLEIFSLGVITNKGPDFFELFSFKESTKSSSVTKEQLLERFSQIDTSHSGVLNKENVSAYLSHVERTDFIGRLIDRVDAILPIKNNVMYLAIMIIVIALFKATMLFMHRYITRVVAIKMSCDLRQEFFEHIQSLPMSFYQQHNIGGLSSRVVGDAALISEAVNACLVNYLQTPFTLISTLTLCFMTSWQLSIMIFMGIPLIAWPIIFLAKRVKRISKLIQRNQEKFAAALVDFLAGIQTVKVFAMEDFSLKKYKEHNLQMAALEMKSARYDLSSRPIVHTLAMVFLATALLYGLYGLDMSIPEVFFYAGMLYLFYEPIKKFAEENSHIQRGISAAERMLEVMNIKPNIQDHPEANTMNDFKDTIEFDNVWFRYNDQWALKGLSFTVKKGETVAIVGPTGAGKSTIVQLLPRLYDVQKGEIRIDGKPIATITQKSLRENIAFIQQKPFLFLDTIAQNIAFGRPFEQEKIQAAAEQAYASEFIVQLPNRYQTELAESGKNLSGGQQQRLAIARALIKQAPILIMDEATSSLDNVSELYIKTALKGMRGQMTQIIIAHRLSTVEDADRIIYLEKGLKVAEGTIEELLISCSGFKHMWETHKGSQERLY